jgi:TRAP-type C4-dicarboxylate transport system permease small subunit
MIIVGVSSLLIGFFYFNPPEKWRIKLLVGMISIIFGIVIVIFSLFGILSFNIYLERLESEGTPASVFPLNLIFVAFIAVGVGLIIHGAIMIKKRDIEKDQSQSTNE